MKIGSSESSLFINIPNLHNAKKVFLYESLYYIGHIPVGTREYVEIEGRKGFLFVTTSSLPSGHWHPRSTSGVAKNPNKKMASLGFQ